MGKVALLRAVSRIERFLSLERQHLQTLEQDKDVPYAVYENRLRAFQSLIDGLNDLVSTATGDAESLFESMDVPSFEALEKKGTTFAFDEVRPTEEPPPLHMTTVHSALSDTTALQGRIASISRESSHRMDEALSEYHAETNVPIEERNPDEVVSSLYDLTKDTAPTYDKEVVPNPMSAIVTDEERDALVSGVRPIDIVSPEPAAVSAIAPSTVSYATHVDDVEGIVADATVFVDDEPLNDEPSEPSEPLLFLDDEPIVEDDDEDDEDVQDDYEVDDDVPQDVQDDGLSLLDVNDDDSRDMVDFNAFVAEPTPTPTSVPTPSETPAPVEDVVMSELPTSVASVLPPSFNGLKRPHDFSYMRETADGVRVDNDPTQIALIQTAVETEGIEALQPFTLGGHGLREGVYRLPEANVSALVSSMDAVMSEKSTYREKPSRFERPVEDVVEKKAPERTLPRMVVEKQEATLQGENEPPSLDISDNELM